MEDLAEKKQQKKSVRKNFRKSCLKTCLSFFPNNRKCRWVIAWLLCRKKTAKIESPKVLPDAYFLDIDDEMLVYLEQQAIDCIKDINQSNITNKENAQKLLSILIVGIGSSFLLLTKENYAFFLSLGIGVFMIYWTYCAVYLVLNVMTGRSRKLMFAPPDALYIDAYKSIKDEDFECFKKMGFVGDNKKLSILRRYRLLELCEISDEMLRQNGTMGKKLNNARIGAILAPFYAIVISAITFAVS